MLRKLGLALGRAAAMHTSALHRADRAEHAHRCAKAMRRTRPGR